MICAIDIGNTKTKAFLLDEKLIVLQEKIWNTPDLFDPERWQYFFETLYQMDSLFFIAEVRISCVSWKAFLALKVYLKYDLPEHFDIHKKFNIDLMILPLKTPIVSESQIPIKRDFIQGLIGTDRLLSAYAAHQIFKTSTIIVSLGTATTIDLVTNNGVFLSGAIIPGLDTAYQGLITRATSLPPITELQEVKQVITHNTLESLYVGSFIAQAILIEGFTERLISESEITEPVDLIITGGRAHSITKHLKKKYKIIDRLVAYGLALIPDWKDPTINKNIDKKYITNLATQLNKPNL
ncbi:MAG: type III pantothenate kinase [Brevinema sp.]